MEEKIMYSNSVSISAQLYDVQLTFEYKNGDSVKTSETIVLSPQHFKVLTEIMANTLTGYENKFGPIIIPPKPDIAHEQG